MKKLFVLAVAALMLVAFSGPAAAEVKVGGKIVFDTYLQQMNAEYRGRTLAAPTISSFKEFVMENNSSTNIHVKWTSDDKKFGAYLEIAVGGGNDFPSGVQYQNAAGVMVGATGLGNINAVDSVYARLSYGWWEFAPGCKLTFGQDYTGFSPLSPLGQMQGTAAGQFKVVGIGFGNLMAGRVYQVRGDFKIGDMGSLGIALIDPHGASLLQGTHWGKNATVNVMGNQICPAGSEETTLPRIDITAKLNFGNISLYPGIVYKKMEWDQPAAPIAGAEMDITTMLYSLGAKANFGPFGITAEFNAGDNPGNANLLTDGTYFGYGPLGAGTGIDMAAIVDGNNQVSDTEFYGYWIDLSYKFGHMTLHGVYGRQHIENDMGQTAALVNNPDIENTRSMWSVNLWIPLSRNMIIIPEMVFYDYGDREIQGMASADLGKASIFGLQWLIMF